jgi:hypothetical protein
MLEYITDNDELYRFSSMKSDHMTSSVLICHLIFTGVRFIILRGKDIKYESELLAFWTLSIGQYSTN